MTNGDHATPAGSTGTVKVMFTVDVEPDNAWADHRTTSVRNVRELQRFQDLLDGFAAKATLLTSYQVACVDETAALLRRLADRHGAEIGAHLHPWETPPFLPSGLDVRYPAFPHELPLSCFEDKMANLTGVLSDRFGDPTSYRAGRWGLAAHHLSVLERLGYRVDTSVTPLIDWRGTMGIAAKDNGQGGPDYRLAPSEPYHPSYDDVRRPGDAKMVEIPLTVAFTRRTPRWVGRNYGRLPLFARRVLRKAELLRPVWAMPAEQSGERLERMVRTLLDGGNRYIVVALHSSELMEGGSPTSPTPEAVDEMFRRLELLLRMAKECGACEFTTLTGAALAWEAHDAAARRTPIGAAR